MFTSSRLITTIMIVRIGLLFVIFGVYLIDGDRKGYANNAGCRRGHACHRKSSGSNDDSSQSSRSSRGSRSSNSANSGELVQSIERVCGYCNSSTLLSNSSGVISPRLIPTVDPASGCRALRAVCPSYDIYNFVLYNGNITTYVHRYPIYLSCGLDDQWYRYGDPIAIAIVYCTPRISTTTGVTTPCSGTPSPCTSATTTNTLETSTTTSASETTTSGTGPTISLTGTTTTSTGPITTSTGPTTTSTGPTISLTGTTTTSTGPTTTSTASPSVTTTAPCSQPTTTTTTTAAPCAPAVGDQQSPGDIAIDPFSATSAEEAEELFENPIVPPTNIELAGKQSIDTEKEEDPFLVPPSVDAFPPVIPEAAPKLMPNANINVVIPPSKLVIASKPIENAQQQQFGNSNFSLRRFLRQRFMAP